MIFAAVGLGLVLASWMWYLSLISAEKVPDRPYLHAALMVLGMVLSAVGTAELATGAIVMAVSAWFLGGFFFYLLSMAALPDGELTVSVGEPLPAFSAADHRGELIASDDWQGKRILLKFFRGQW